MDLKHDGKIDMSEWREGQTVTPDSTKEVTLRLRT